VLHFLLDKRKLKVQRLKDEAQEMQQLAVPPGTSEIREMLIGQGFDADEAKSVLWDLISGEISFEDQEAKNTFVSLILYFFSFSLSLCLSMMFTLYR
jgi:hypothetical protein